MQKQNQHLKYQRISIELLKDFGAENEMEVSELISSVEIECYHPNAESKPLSKGVLTDPIPFTRSVLSDDGVFEP